MSSPTQGSPSRCASAGESDRDIRPPTGISLSLLVGGVVFLVGTITEALLPHGDTHRLIGILDELLLATITGVVVLFYERRRARELQRQLRVIGETNHHVRNALQAIVSSSTSLADEPRRLALMDAVDRIDWTLRTVLCGISEASSSSKS